MIAISCACIIAFSILLCSIRLFRGPKFSDRVVALDLAGTLTIALIMVYVHIAEEMVYLDVAIILAPIAFLGTVIFARFLESASESSDSPKKKALP